MTSTQETITDKGRMTRAEYLRRWRRANPDKCKKYANRYWNNQANKADNGTNQKETNTTEE